ncbi:hypothetical protein FJQ98_20360 [Lysinibacillus agricola]|uniref:BclB domain-containing protein n=2 Tax=Bacillaceae TaxID=186817 RepID=A0ABX7AYM3_9BACI|nr:hypothetical protein FJQ98_20360 [Lysinibacillus agricola]
MDCRCNCPSEKKVECNAGPFVGIDAACITPPTATGFMIPYASGINPVTMDTLDSGLAGTVSTLGFGTTLSVPLTGTTIVVITGTEAFSVSRAGNITAISASFTSTSAVTFAGTVTITAQIYSAPAGSNTFSPTTALVNLTPSLTTVTPGTIANGTINVAPVPVSPGDLLLMVFSATATGTGSLVNTVQGFGSASITIV